MSFVPSPYQAKLFEALWDPLGPRSIVMNARAGSGKSTTAVQAIRGVPGSGRTFPSGDPVPSVLVACFNVGIREELDRMLKDCGHAEVRGAHSCGFRTVRQALGRDITVDAGRYWKLALALLNEAAAQGHPDSGLSKDVLELLKQARLGTDARRLGGAEIPAREEVDVVVRVARDLANQARLALVDPSDRDALGTLAQRFNLVWPDWAEHVVPNLVWHMLLRGADPAQIKEQGIDFTDQLWLPIVLRLRPYNHFPLVVVDEAQDLSPVMLELVLSHVHPRGGRFVALGDPEQAINAFAGADADSFPKIIERTSATVLPLPICYRCDRRIVDVARYWTPDIEPRPDAADGEVATLTHEQYLGRVEPGDLVLARTNVVLVAGLFGLIKAGKPAIVKGRPGLTQGFVDAVKALEKLAGATAWTDSGWATAPAEVYERRERGKILAASRGDTSDSRLELLADQVAATLFLIEHTEAPDLQSFQAKLESLFQQTAKDHLPPTKITLSSSHRAKGLGAPRVFVLGPEKYPLMRYPPRQRDTEGQEEFDMRLAVWEAQQRADARQEANLMYVTVTRAKHALYFVGGWGGFSEAVRQTPWHQAYRAQFVQATGEEAVKKEEAVEKADAASALWEALVQQGKAREVENSWRAGYYALAVHLARQIDSTATPELLQEIFGVAPPFDQISALKRSAVAP